MYQLQKHIVFMSIYFVLFTILYPLFPGMLSAVLAGGAQYSYRLFMPVIVIFILWLRADRLRQTPVSASAGGLCTAAAGLAGCFVFARVFRHDQLLGVCVLAAIAGSLWWVLGTRIMRQIAGPLFLLAFMIPLNDLRQTLLSLRRIFGYVVTALVDPIYLLATSDIPPVQYTKMAVAADNGAVLERYFIALSIVSAVYVLSIRGAKVRRALVAALFAPIALAADTLRMLVLGTAAWWYGADVVMQKTFMTAAGVLFWGGALVMLVTVKRMLLNRHGQRHSGSGTLTRLRRESTSTNPAKEEEL